MLNGMEFEMIVNLRCEHIFAEEQTFAIKTICILILVYLCSWLVCFYITLYLTLNLHSCDVFFTITIDLLKPAIFKKRLNTMCQGSRRNHP